MAQLRISRANVTDEIRTLERDIRQYSQAYYTGTALVSDAAFDALLERLATIAPKSPVLYEVGYQIDAGPAALRTGKIQHTFPMLSLDKVTQDKPALLRWMDRLAGGQVSPSLKIDGLAVSLTYTNGHLSAAVTRGDGSVGEDVLSQAVRIPNLPQVLRPPSGFSLVHGIVVRGEVCVSRKTFKALFAEQYSNERNFAAGALRSAATGLAESLTFLAYDLRRIDGRPAFRNETEKNEILTALGFLPVVTLDPCGAEQIGPVLDTVESARDALDWVIDGVVLKAWSTDLQGHLGVGPTSPKYAIAYKYRAVEATTVLLDVLWQVARSGILSPVAILQPVQVGDVTVSRASLFNLQQIEQRELCIGDTVTVSRRGDVIPHVEGRAKAGLFRTPIQPPTSCPSCGGAVLIDNAGKVTANHADNCIPVTVSRLVGYARTMRMMGWGPELMDALVASGVASTPADLYTLSVRDLRETGLSDAFARKLLRSRAEASIDVPADRFLAALGIHGVGEAGARGLLDSTEPWTVEGLLGAENGPMPEWTAGLVPNLTFVYPWRREGSGTPGPLDGMRIVFTGKLPIGRKEAENLVRRAGGTIVSAVPVSPDENFMLVVGPDADEGTAKYKAAVRTGARIVPIESLLDMCRTLTPGE